jgi:hypothetical protein
VTRRQGTVQPGHLQSARQKDGVWLYAMHLCKIHMLVEVHRYQLSLPGKPHTVKRHYSRYTDNNAPVTMHTQGVLRSLTTHAPRVHTGW